MVGGIRPEIIGYSPEKPALKGWLFSTGLCRPRNIQLAVAARAKCK